MKRRKPEPWPVLDRVVVSKKRPGHPQWQKGVLRPAEGVSIEQHGSNLVLSGAAGTITLRLPELDPTGMMAFKLLQVPATSAPPQQQQGPDRSATDTTATSARPVVVLASPDPQRYTAVVQALEAAFQGVQQGYTVGITVKGVGYRMEPVDTPAGSGSGSEQAASTGGQQGSTQSPSALRGRRFYYEPRGGDAPALTYPHPRPVQAVRLRVGYSRPVVFQLPPDVKGFCIRPTLMYLYGLQKQRLDQLAAEIRALRKPSVYTGNGIQIVGEALRQKQRASRKSK